METPQPEGCLESGEDPGVSTPCFLQATHHLYPELGSAADTTQKDIEDITKLGHRHKQKTKNKTKITYTNKTLKK